MDRHLFAQRHQERAIERARRPADLHNQLRPDRLQGLRQRLCGKRVDVCQNAFEAALHVQAVITIADRLVERGELVGVGDHGFGDRLDELALDCLVHHRAPPVLNRAPSAPKNIGCENSIVTASPTASPASVWVSVTTSRPATETCRWFWSPRCSTQVTLPSGAVPFTAFPIRKCSVLAPIVAAFEGARRLGKALRGNKLMRG